MIQPVVSSSSPQPPATIQQLLALYAVPVRLVSAQLEVPAAQRVQPVLLEDSLGSLLVLFAEDCLLDLKRLGELTGRPLQAARRSVLDALLTGQGLASLPALPASSAIPCLYDMNLALQRRLWLPSGEPGLLLEVTGEEFRHLLEKASAGQFGIPVARLRPNLDRPDQDRAQISQAVENFTTRRIRQRLEETLEIPPLPQTANRIIRLRVDPNATVDDIADVVETDPALAAQVISWAASPYYGARGKIRSVEDAIVRVLGFDLVINLALGLALGKTLALPKEESQTTTPYWQQAIYTAAVVDGLLRLMPREQRPEAGLAYLGGLLHNFGYLVLAHVFPPHFQLLCKHRDVNPHLHHSVIEQHLLGITREQIGGWLMHFWGMPEELSTALRFQHDAGYQGDHAAYANLIGLAVRLLAQRGIGGDPAMPIPATLFEQLGIEPAEARVALDKVLDAEAALRALAGQMQAPGTR